MKKKTIALLLVIMIALVLGCTKEHEGPAAAQNHHEVFSIREGQRLFIHYCSPCHGEEGDGFGKNFSYELKPQPPDFTAADFLQNRNDEGLYLSISEGTTALGKSNLCPPWGKTFHREEIEYLIAYIKKLHAGPSE